MKIVDWLKSIVERFDQGINCDESVVFYPSYGFKDTDGKWKLEVRGTISEEIRILRKLPQIALTLAGAPSPGKLADLLEDLAEDVDTIQYFKERSAPFLVDAESNEQFDIELAGQSYSIGRSSSVGYFDNLIGLPDPLVESSFVEVDAPWFSFTAADNDMERFFSGKSQVLQSTGVTVVSDIDDTIKDSNVPEPVQLVINTLFRPFKAVSGMADIYQAWHKHGASFVYLSNSPYQLYEPLTQFLQKIYPEGAYYMRLLDWGDVRESIDKLIASDEETGSKENPKKHNLIPILERFPNRKFILVGDSTEHDAEIYADLYLGRNFPDGFSVKPYSDRIEKIYIRDVPNSEKRAEAREALDTVNAESTGVALLFENPEVMSEDARSVFQDR